MVIQFCSKCGGIMELLDDNVICDNCGFIEKSNKKKLSVKEKIESKKLRGKGVVEDKNVFATYKHVCSKCGYGKAEIIDQGVKYSDEAGVLLLKCGKCGWAEHLNKKVS